MVVTCLTPIPLTRLLNRDPAVIGQIQIVHVDAGIRLVACHGRGAVVENDQREIMVVEHGIHESGDARVKECGIPDKGYDLFVGCFWKTRRTNSRKIPCR